MNRRLYDLVIGRMFSADNFVQDPYFSQSYNRYTYVLNNPLKYTDPTGELTFYDIAAGAAIAGGTALMFVPGAQPVGATLIMGGVTHFAASAALAQQGSSWNEASNVAGLSFAHQQYFAATTGPAAGPGITGTGPTGIQYYAVDAQRGYEADYYAFNTDDPLWGVSEWDRTLASTDMEWEFLYGRDGADLVEGITSVSALGIAFIKSYEKLRLQPYDASGSANRGDWTIGWGHKILPGEDYSGGITAQQAEQLFSSDLRNKAVRPILKHVTVPLSQQQFDALASYVFNVGPGNSLIGTNLIRHLNAGNYSKAVVEMDIATQQGVFMQGLHNRRQAEQQIWNHAIYKMHK